MTIEGRKETDNIETFSWSQKQMTVGAVFSNGLGFWSQKQNFQFGIYIATKSFNCIQYLQSFDIWIVIEFVSGKVCEFNLEKQKCIQQFVNKKISKDIVKFKPKIFVQVKNTGLFGIVLGSQIQFIHFKKKQVISKISISTNIRCLSYSDSYQLLFVCGYETKISVFQLNLCFGDFEQKQSKIETRQVFECCIYKPGTETLVTYDDKKTIRLWNIKLMQCYQFFKTTAEVILMKISLNKLIISAKHLTHYQFQQKQIPLRQVISAIAVSEDWIFLGTGKTLKYFSWNDGKVKKVIEGIFKEDEDIVYLQIDSDKRQIIIIGQFGTIQKRLITSTQIVFQTKKQPYQQYSYDQNISCLFHSSDKLQISLISNQFQTVRTLNFKVKIFAFNSFAGLLGVLYQKSVYVIKYSQMILTHLIQLPHYYELLDIMFIEGTNTILLFSKYRVDMIVLTSEGKYTAAFRFDYKIPMRDQPQIFSFPQTIFQRRILQQINLFIGTQQGSIYKLQIKDLNIKMCQPQIIETKQALSYKQLSVSSSTLIFKYSHQKINIDQLKKTEVQNNRKQIKTKLNSIKSLIIKQKVIASNVTKVLIYNKQLDSIGELNIDSSFPIQWFSLQQKKNSTDFSHKLLNHLGHAKKNSKQLFDMQKSYVTKQQFEDHRYTRQNLFKAKSKTKAYEKDTQKIMIQSKTMQSLHNKTMFKNSKQQIIQQRTYSRQRIISQKLTTTLSKTIEARKDVKVSKLFLNGKHQSPLQIISSIQTKLKSSRFSKRLLTQPSRKLPSISSRFND